MGKPNQLPQHRTNGGAETVDIALFAFRQAVGFAGQGGRAGLPVIDPLAVQRIAIADQDALPVFDQTLECFFKMLPPVKNGPTIAERWTHAEVADFEY